MILKLLTNYLGETKELVLNYQMKEQFATPNSSK